jgi:hypothetical protein
MPEEQLADRLFEFLKPYVVRRFTIEESQKFFAFLSAIRRLEGPPESPEAEETIQATVADLTPAQRVKGVHFKIDSKRYLSIDGNHLNYCHKEKYGIQQQCTLADARRQCAALHTALSTYDGKPFEDTADIENWELKRQIQYAKDDIRKMDADKKELEELLEVVRIRGY